MKPERPARMMSPEEIESYRRDGVVCLRGLYSSDWVDRLTEGFDEILNRANFQMPGISETFRSDAYTWMTNDVIRDFVLNAPSAHIAQQAFGSETINFFYDQVFIKLQQTPDPTPCSGVHHVDEQVVELFWISLQCLRKGASALHIVFDVFQHFLEGYVFLLAMEDIEALNNGEAGIDHCRKLSAEQDDVVLLNFRL